MSLTTIGYNRSASITEIALTRQGRIVNGARRQLASGRRINSTADDTSGFALARALENHRRSLQTAIDNMGNAENILNIATSSYDTVSLLLMDIKDLVIMGADGSWNAASRDAIQGQIDALLLEIDDTVDEGRFGGTNLIDGSFVGKKFQVGAIAGEIMNVSLDDASTAVILSGAIDVSSANAANASINIIDAAQLTVQNSMQRAGEALLKIHTKQQQTDVRMTSTEATRSIIEDTDFAQAAVVQSRSMLLQQMGFQNVGDAIVAPQVVLSLFV